MSKVFKLATAVFVGLFFAGCMTTTLQTTAKMTQSIFIDPVAKEKRVVFISAKNTSGQNVNIANKLANLLIQKGYTITDDPELATYILLTNILYADRKQENNAAGAAVTGGAIGSSIGAYNSNGIGGTIVGGLVGAAVTGVIGKLTEDTIYQMQVDVVIRQRLNSKVLVSSGNLGGQANVVDKRKAGFLNEFGGAVRNSEATGNLNSNQTNHINQTYEKNYVEQKTIMFAEATKRGLSFEEATPILEDKIATQISGLF